MCGGGACKGRGVKNFHPGHYLLRLAETNKFASALTCAISQPEGWRFFTAACLALASMHGEQKRAIDKHLFQPAKQYLYALNLPSEVFMISFLMQLKRIGNSHPFYFY